MNFWSFRQKLQNMVTNVTVRFALDQCMQWTVIPLCRVKENYLKYHFSLLLLRYYIIHEAKRCFG